MEIPSRRNPNIDVGLAVLSVVNRSGTPLTQTDIAEVCGVPFQTIQKIEKQALRKMRFRLRGMREEMRP